MKIACFAFGLFLAGVSVASNGRPEEPLGIPEIVELVYIETNIDNSAGGHLALRIEQQVYHYQSVESRLLLVRQPWLYFRDNYLQLENRGLLFARLDLTAAQRRYVESHFNRQLIVQQRHLLTEQLLLLQRDWVAAGAVALPGLGYFQVIPEERHTPSLDLSAPLTEIQEALLHLDPVIIDEPQDLSRGVLTDTFFSDLEHRQDLLLRRAALSVIQSDVELRPENLVYLEQNPLLEHERHLLRQYESELQRSVDTRLNRPSAGDGYSFLISRARLLAVRQSLARGHWVFLNSFPMVAQRNGETDELKQEKVWLELQDQVAQAWQVTRTSEMLAGELDEQAYTRLETAASRMYASNRTISSFKVKEGWQLGVLMPQRTALLRAESYPSNSATSHLAEVAAQYSAALSGAYAYRLSTQNCVTELVQALNEGAGAAGEVEAILGAHLDAKRGLNFIPRVLFGEASAKLNVRELRYAPSRRQQAIAEMHEQHPSWHISLRESNIWTSQAYPGSIEDDAFLFFTDGATWLRPLQGVANVGYAAIASGLGLMTAPFDGGDRLSEGLRGMFYSAPELVFINLRKGQYDTLPAP